MVAREAEVEEATRSVVAVVPPENLVDECPLSLANGLVTTEKLTLVRRPRGVLVRLLLDAVEI